MYHLFRAAVNIFAHSCNSLSVPNCFAMLDSDFFNLLHKASSMQIPCQQPGSASRSGTSFFFGSDFRIDPTVGDAGIE